MVFSIVVLRRVALMYVRLESMTFKAIKFPSPNFPSADLRVNSDTQYEFTCVSCSTLLSIHFGWILQWNYPPPTVPPEQMEAVSNYFQVGGGSDVHFELIKCFTCEEAYIVQAQIEETSNGAYRIVVSGAAQVTT